MCAKNEIKRKQMCFIKRRTRLPTWGLESPRNGGPDGTRLMLPVVPDRLPSHVSHHRHFRLLQNCKPIITQRDWLTINATNRQLVICACSQFHYPYPFHLITVTILIFIISTVSISHSYIGSFIGYNKLTVQMFSGKVLKYIFQNS